MPHPFRSRCPKECRRGGKILKNPGKMQFSGTCNLTGTFFNESFVGNFCENLQRNMRLSATHRMPPAKKSRSQHVKHLKPIFSKYSVYAGVLCTSCSPHRMPPKTNTNVIILLQRRKERGKERKKERGKDWCGILSVTNAPGRDKNRQGKHNSCGKQQKS